MAGPTWHQIGSDGTVRFRSAGLVSNTVLRALYENGTGFDVELFGTAPPGENPDALQPIRAHKMILMHASKHLHELFTVDGYLDSHRKQYKLTEISHESLNDVVKFVYTDELNFSADCASHRMQNVLIASKFLVMSDLADACETYLASDVHLAVQNCMSMLRFARKYACLLLLTALLNLTARNLPYFIDNLDFLNLTKEDVTKLMLSEPLVTLADADQRCHAAVAWLNHDRAARDACTGDILSMVPFDPSTISLHTLAAVGNNSAIRTRYAEKFLNVMFDGVKNCRLRNDERCSASSNQTVSDVWWNATNNKNARNTDMWYIIGGSNAPTAFVAYDVMRRNWLKLRDLPWNRTVAGACVMANKTIFVFGGEKNNQTSADIDQFNLSTSKWTTSSTKLSVARGRLSACSNNYRPTSDEPSAFIFGGYPEVSSAVVEKLCISDVGGTLSIKPISKMEQCYNVTAVFAGDAAVFVAGGTWDDSSDSRLSSIKKFDCTANKWSTVGDMSCGRSSYMAAVLGDDLYLAGGYDGKSALSLVEVFNVKTGQVRRAPDMLSTRCSGSGVALDRSVFCAVGGSMVSTHSPSLQSVECFDVREGKWSTGSIVPDMPTANRNFSFASV